MVHRRRLTRRWSNDVGTDVVTSKRNAHHNKQPIHLLRDGASRREVHRLVGLRDRRAERRLRIHAELPLDALTGHMTDT